MKTTNPLEQQFSLNNVNKIIAEALILNSYDKKGEFLTYKETIKGHEGVDNEDGVQGEYNETHKILQLKDYPEIFLKLTFTSDSYGDNLSLTSFAFVKAKTKTITVYEFD